MFGKDEILAAIYQNYFNFNFIDFFVKYKTQRTLDYFVIIFFGISIFLSSERTSFIHYAMFSSLFIFLSSHNFKKKFLSLF